MVAVLAVELVLVQLEAQQRRRPVLRLYALGRGGGIPASRGRSRSKRARSGYWPHVFPSFRSFREFF